MDKQREKILSRDFFERSPHKVAAELPGKNLGIELGGKRSIFHINEIEIYDGTKDKACHAFKGRTTRTEVMFNTGGVWYVYLIYGMYYMLNIVVGENDYPAAILIRGAGEYDGPGKLTKALGINKIYNGLTISRESGLWIEESDLVVPKSKILCTPRIGINYAGEPWLSKKWRFCWRDQSD